MSAEVIKHAGEEIPVSADVLVQYRTISAEGRVSHWHHQQYAGLLNWSSHIPRAAPGFTSRCLKLTPLFLGRIYDYSVVPS